METLVPTLVRDDSVVMLMFVFGCRASTAVSLRDADIDITDERVTAVLVHRKGKRTLDPLVLQYDRNPMKIFAKSPLALLSRWPEMRPTSDAFFCLAEEEDLSATSATHAVAALASALSPSPPVGCTYSSHSARISAYNEWMALSFPTPWIMHRMGWESDGMLRVYYDWRITVTDDSGWFFARTCSLQ
jgi:integrase